MGTCENDVSWQECGELGDPGDHLQEVDVKGETRSVNWGGGKTEISNCLGKVNQPPPIAAKHVNLNLGS